MNTLVVMRDWRHRLYMFAWVLPATLLLTSAPERANARLLQPGETARNPDVAGFLLREDTPSNAALDGGASSALFAGLMMNAPRAEQQTRGGEDLTNDADTHRVLGSSSNSFVGHAHDRHDGVYMHDYSMYRDGYTSTPRGDTEYAQTRQRAKDSYGDRLTSRDSKTGSNRDTNQRAESASKQNREQTAYNQARRSTKEKPNKVILDDDVKT